MCRNKTATVKRVKYFLMYFSKCEISCIEICINEHAYGIKTGDTMYRYILVYVLINSPWSYDLHVWCWHNFTSSTTLQGLQPYFMSACSYVYQVDTALIFVPTENLINGKPWLMSQKKMYLRTLTFHRGHIDVEVRSTNKIYHWHFLYMPKVMVLP